MCLTQGAAWISIGQQALFAQREKSGVTGAVTVRNNSQIETFADNGSTFSAGGALEHGQT